MARSPELLRARPQASAAAASGAPDEPPLAAGAHPLFPRQARPGLLLVPPGSAAGPQGVAVVLHGAGGDAPGMARLFAPLVRACPGALWAFPESRADSWDVIVDELGPDVARLDAALASIFARYAVDPARVVIAGFSDGASYALTLGLANGGLFRAVLAFSPGFDAAPARRGMPRVFVSHGVGDPILPIGATSRRIVPRLERQGYAVTYAEFDGGHEVPERIQGHAAGWLGWAAGAQPAA